MSRTTQHMNMKGNPNSLKNPASIRGKQAHDTSKRGIQPPPSALQSPAVPAVSTAQAPSMLAAMAGPVVAAPASVVVVATTTTTTAIQPTPTPSSEELLKALEKTLSQKMRSDNITSLEDGDLVNSLNEMNLKKDLEDNGSALRKTLEGLAKNLSSDTHPSYSLSFGRYVMLTTYLTHLKILHNTLHTTLLRRFVLEMEDYQNPRTPTPTPTPLNLKTLNKLIKYFACLGIQDLSSLTLVGAAQNNKNRCIVSFYEGASVVLSRQQNTAKTSKETTEVLVDLLRNLGTLIEFLKLRCTYNQNVVHPSVHQFLTTLGTYLSRARFRFNESQDSRSLCNNLTRFIKRLGLNAKIPNTQTYLSQLFSTPQLYEWADRHSHTTFTTKAQTALFLTVAKNCCHVRASDLKTYGDFSRKQGIESNTQIKDPFDRTLTLEKRIGDFDVDMTVESRKMLCAIEYDGHSSHHIYRILEDGTFCSNHLNGEEFAKRIYLTEAGYVCLNIDDYFHYSVLNGDFNRWNSELAREYICKMIPNIDALQLDTRSCECNKFTPGFEAAIRDHRNQIANAKSAALVSTNANTPTAATAGNGRPSGHV